MRPALSTKFVEKAEAAFVAAVEAYNKPAFRYREETFAILALNAWELLLKAQILRGAGNNPKAIRVYETRKTKRGTQSRKQYLRKNRSGAPMTVGMSACVSVLDNDPATRLAPELKANLDALAAVRDNAAHYIHASPVLARQVLEIATASVRNFINLSKSWFERDLSDVLSLTMPLAFISKPAEAVVVTRGEQQLIKYLQDLATTSATETSTYAVAVKLNVKFERSKLTTASKVQVTNDPDAVRVTLTEQDHRERYPLDYKELCTKCSERYSDFKQDKRFHDLRKSVLADARFAYSRYLDPTKPGLKKDFYSSAILELFDKHYTRT